MTEEVTARIILADGSSVSTTQALTATASGWRPDPQGTELPTTAEERPTIGLFPDQGGCVRISAVAGMAIQSVEVSVTSPLRNFDQVIVPDTGRWFMNSDHPISAWRFSSKLRSRANSIKTPLFIFGGVSGSTEIALGLVAEPHEFDVEICEPASNRALNVHFRRLNIKFTLGTEDAPLQGEARPDSETTLWLVVRRPGSDEHWTQTLEAYSDLERRLLDIRYQVPVSASRPFWCTWVDWSSDQLTQPRVPEKAQRAVELGFGNIVIDDGWFGPGLDSPYDVPLNIGDWSPDPDKFPDFGQLLVDVHELGASVILWCAPHAVGPAAHCFTEMAPLLIGNDQGEPTMNPTMFYSLCFKNPQARDVMAAVVERLTTRHDIDGLKYDLFNWLPDEECSSVRHEHDLTSTIEGLRRTLEACRSITDRAPRDMLIELKQDYGPPRIAELGTLMRAGDAPYASYTNLVRTSYLQARGMHALNDYQTFADDDQPATLAVIGLRMVAAGVPAWGRDLTRLRPEQASVISRLHSWYDEQVSNGGNTRRTHDVEGNLQWELAHGVVKFCTTPGTITHVTPEVVQVVNATTQTTLMLRFPGEQADGQQRRLMIRPLTHLTQQTVIIKLGRHIEEVAVNPGDILVLDSFL